MTGEAVTTERTITSNSLRTNNKTTTISSAARLRSRGETANCSRRTCSAANRGNINDKRNANARVSSVAATSNDMQIWAADKKNSAAGKSNDVSRGTAAVTT